MAISGKDAVQLLRTVESICKIHRQDNTDKMWSYKAVGGCQGEFAFDPKTKTKLTIRLDIQPPLMRGLIHPIKIEGDSISTALRRVFSGGDHIARWKVEIEDEAAMLAFVEYLSSYRPGKSFIFIDEP